MARTRQDTPARSRREVDVSDRALHAEERPTRRATEAPIPTPATNGSAIAALAIGLLSATFAFLIAPALAAIIFGLVAIVLGVKGVQIANATAGTYKGLAISGIVSGALGLLLGIAVIAGGVTLYQNVGTDDLPAVIREPIEDVTN
jgi:uncharacterized membrane protein